MESSIGSTLGDDGVATVAVQGEIDFSNAGELAQALCAAIADWSPDVLRADLGAATFFDSTGLGALIEGYRAARAADTRFLVLNPTDGFRKVLAVTGLDEFFGLAAESGLGEDGKEPVEAAGA